MIVGLAAAGAALLAVDSPSPTGPPVQHHAVQLAAGEVDWSTFISNTDANLASLQTEATTSSAQLSTALTNVSDHFSTQISTALTGFDTGVNNALFGGWYGGDDGYVFGLFGGEPVIGPNGATETGSLLATLSNDLQAGSTEKLYSDLNAYSLELLDHTAKPLLAPLLDETSGHGATAVTTLSIPVELSQIQTNLLEQFASYNELKGVAETVLSPQISGFFELTKDLDAIGSELAGGDSTQGLSDLNNLSSDVLNAVVNGYDFGKNPFNGAEELFPGLINNGSFLNELYTTWTQQFVTALGSLAVEPAASGSAEAVTGTVPDLFAGLLSF